MEQCTTEACLFACDSLAICYAARLLLKHIEVLNIPDLFIFQDKLLCGTSKKLKLELLYPSQTNMQLTIYLNTIIDSKLARGEKLSTQMNTTSTHLPCKIWLLFTLFPLSVWQQIAFHARQACEQ